MNVFLKTICAVLAAAALAACANLIGPRQIDVPLSKLQAGMDRRFPVHNKAMELFDINLSGPQLALLPMSGRVALTMEASVAPFFTSRAWHGSLVLSGRLFVDTARGGIFMGEPQVERFAIDGMDETRQRQLAKAATALMNKLARDTPLYSFRMEELRYAGV